MTTSASPTNGVGSVASTPYHSRATRSLPALIAAELKQEVLNGSYQPGEQLPSEAALAREKGVSRATIRSAIRTLTNMGLLHVRHGAGTFVTPRQHLSIVSDLQELRSTSQIVREACGDCDIKYLHRELRMTTEAESTRFDASRAVRVVAIRRNFYANEAPVAFEESMVNHELLPESFAADEFGGAIFPVLERLGLLPVRSVARVIPAVLPNEEDPGQNGTSRLCLCLVQKSYLPNGLVVTWSRTHFVSEHFEFTITRTLV